MINPGQNWIIDYSCFHFLFNLKEWSNVIWTHSKLRRVDPVYLKFNLILRSKHLRCKIKLTIIIVQQVVENTLRVVQGSTGPIEGDRAGRSRYLKRYNSIAVSIIARIELHILWNQQTIL